MKKIRLIYLPEARNAVKKLPPAVKPIIKREIEKLQDNPHLGKELIDELDGFRSLVISRYRVIYFLPDYESAADIQIHFIGHRRDVYMKFKEMLSAVKNRHYPL